MSDVQNSLRSVWLCVLASLPHCFMVYRETYSKYLRKKLSNFLILFILAQRLWFVLIFVVMCNELNVLACFIKGFIFSWLG
jgi:hypothetical protein